MKKIFLALLFISTLSHSQNISFDLFTISIFNSSLIVEDKFANVIYRQAFSNPTIFEFDLDDDGINELLLQDSLTINSKTFFKLFICNTVDSFYIADSIYSGSYQPYPVVSEEIGSNIIISGNADLEKLNLNEFSFLPLNCWKYESGELFSVNDELYEIYLVENNSIINFIDDYFSANIQNCGTAEIMKAAIASVYVNYLNAGEKSVASQFIKKYYLCEDNEQFIKELESLSLRKENQ